jgi:hypothetical protein
VQRRSRGSATLPYDARSLGFCFAPPQAPYGCAFGAEDHRFVSAYRSAYLKLVLPVAEAIRDIRLAISPMA